MSFTRLRDVEGTVWHIPNGEILRVGNKSQRWARALLDVDVAYGTDIDRAQVVIKRVAKSLSDEAGSHKMFDIAERLEGVMWEVKKRTG